MGSGEKERIRILRNEILERESLLVQIEETRLIKNELRVRMWLE
jgi:hypothetical protein